MGYSTDEVAAMIEDERRIGKEGTITPIPKGKLLEQAVSQPPPESAPIVMMVPAPSGGEKQPNQLHLLKVESMLLQFCNFKSR